MDQKKLDALINVRRVPKPKSGDWQRAGTDVAEFARLADAFVEIVRERFNPRFGFDRDSIGWLDEKIDTPVLHGNARVSEICSALYERGLVVTGMNVVFGSFVGECLVRVRGGEWTWNDALRGWGVVLGPSFCFPHSKALKRILNGPQDSVATFYDFVGI